ncbi:zinc carboxypeptidase [Luteibacter rhizovicinus]|uniref:Zinc carboxypeptidase n=1 Tax=Luteibacter rhizovicinus TaxID=242606 RepID=A0A4R3YHH7_9GAMM|nr:zinc carboxypeptidase [Luteibacter rhizovicinus]
MRRLFLLSLLAVTSMTLDAKDSWTTPAEASAFRTTPSYDETLAYLHRLVQAAPDRLRLEQFGTTPEGRPMMIVVAGENGDLTPERARAAGKPVVLLQAGIHPGEIEGKDAGLMLLRDYAVTGKLPHLLDRAILVFIPVFSVDGHENSSPYHRINQNGPESMGFRGQSQYLNLNRDYVKADAPEMRAWLKLWNTWTPDLLVDIHTTDGADYQYDLTWYAEDAHKLPPSIAAWQKAAYDGYVMPHYEKLGHLAAIYLEFKDGRDMTKGIQNFGSGPRFSTGYAAIQNRAGLLIETHMLKPYDVRVRATYDVVRTVLDYVSSQPAALRDASREADAWIVKQARLPVTYKASPESTPFVLKGVAFTQEHSDISGDTWVRYDPKVRKDYPVQNWNALEPDQSVNVPGAYVIPAQWTDAIERLDAHGVRYTRTTAPAKIEVTRYQLDDPVWASKSFERHLMLRDVKQREVHDTVTVPVGSVVVPMDQRAANVAVNLLEPQAPDSLLRWGYFNAVFEPKEYGEPRVVEALARDMLAKDPGLRREFDERVKNDPAFAASASARLMFFFQRSPWYSAQGVGAYPVLKVAVGALKDLR